MEERHLYQLKHLLPLTPLQRILVPIIKSRPLHCPSFHPLHHNLLGLLLSFHRIIYHLSSFTSLHFHLSLYLPSTLSAFWFSKKESRTNLVVSSLGSERVAPPPLKSSSSRSLSLSREQREFLWVRREEMEERRGWVTASLYEIDLFNFEQR